LDISQKACNLDGNSELRSNWIYICIMFCRSNFLGVVEASCGSSTVEQCWILPGLGYWVLVEVEERRRAEADWVMGRGWSGVCRDVYLWVLVGM